MYASCGWRLACALPFFAAILLALGAGHALGATPPGASVSSSNPNASFTGHVDAANFFPATCDTPQCLPGTSPTPCTDQATDPINLICEHFTVAAAEDGSVAACVSFPASADLDVYVVTSDSSGFTTLVTSSTGTDEPECVSFAVASSHSYELQISGFDVPLGGVDLAGRVTFSQGAGGGTGNVEGGGGITALRSRL